MAFVARRKTDCRCREPVCRCRPLGRGGGSREAEGVAKAKERGFQSHVQIEMARSLLFGPFEIIEQIQEEGQVSPFGRLLQLGQLIDVKQLLLVPAYMHDNEVTNPSPEPA